LADTRRHPSSRAAHAALLDVRADEFAEAFGRSPLLIRHHVDVAAPLFTRDALVARAADWPGPWVEHHQADLPFVLPSGKTDRLSVDPGEVVRGIETNGCWVVLWQVEHSPRYATFLDECLDRVDALVAGREGGVTSRGMNLLIASPRAVAPAHFDMHHNFLLQIQGTKDVMIGTFSDPRLAERAIDRYYDEHNNNLHVLPDVVSTFRLAPGDGLYIPPFAFHWVRGGDDASVGASCGFRTQWTEQLALVHAFNAKLRRLGVHPVPAGRSPRRDRAKATAFTSARRARRTVRSADTWARRRLGRSAESTT
jgi:hypothetical protein